MKAENAASRQAVAQIAFEHVRGISNLVTSIERQSSKLDMGQEILFLEALFAYDLDDDDAYKKDMKKIREDFNESKKPPKRHPETWRYQGQFAELKALISHGRRKGLFAGAELEEGTTPL